MTWKIFIYLEKKKKKFKEVLLSLENRSSKLIITDYAKCVDYQLMDYDLIENDDISMRIRSDYPVIVKYYKDIMNISIDPNEEIKIYVNQILSHIYDNVPELNINFNTLAGHKFETIVKLNFFVNNNFRKDFDPEQKREGMKRFNLYNLFFQEDLEMNVFSKNELKSSEFLSTTDLPYNHILNNKTIPRPQPILKLLYNTFFYNGYSSTPIIDGGLIYYSDHGIRNIITYDATVGDEHWKDLKNIQLKKDQIEFYMKRYPQKKKSIVVHNLIKVIAKLDLILPKTFEAILQAPHIFKFNKHLIIVPNLKGTTIIF